MVRSWLVAIVMLAGVIFAPPAFAHAVLVSTDPAAGAVLQQAPDAVTVRFSEPTRPVVMRMTGPDGGTIELKDYSVQGNDIVISLPELDQGTHIVSWRVVSADGHPVGGAVGFSVGVITADGSTVESVDPLLRALIWIVRVMLYAALFVGGAGTFFAAWIAAPLRLPKGIISSLRRLMVLGLVATPFAFVLQGLDLRGEPIGSVFDMEVWKASLESPYTATLLAAALTFALGLWSLVNKKGARALSGIALLGVGASLALSGHASNAPPQALTWFVVMVHAIAVAFWVGSLLPLASIMGQPNRESIAALSRFSIAVPNAIVALIVAGALLIVVQIKSPSDLWTSSYGLILSAKLLLVVGLLAIALVNRARLTPLVKAEPSMGGPALRRTTITELVLVFLVFGLVAGWRFTPPPRSITPPAALAQQVQIEAAALSADVRLTPGQVGPMSIDTTLFAPDRTGLVAQELSIAISNPEAGIEKLTQKARLVDGVWSADGFVVPVPGKWTIELTALISDFDRRIASGSFTIADPVKPAASGPAPVVAADGHVHSLSPDIDVSDPFVAVVVDPSEAPSIDLLLNDAGDGKMNLSFALQKFRFGSEADGTEHKPGVGHGHIFINGDYIADADAETIPLELKDGVSEIYVGLSALDHRAYATEGRAIDGRAVVLRGGSPIRDERHVIEVPVTLGDSPPTFTAKLGETLELRLTSADDQIIHLHGYDIETTVSPRSPVKIILNADFAGRFAAEAHDANATVVFYLEVQP